MILFPKEKIGVIFLLVKRPYQGGGVRGGVWKKTIKNTFFFSEPFPYMKVVNISWNIACKARRAFSNLILGYRLNRDGNDLWQLECRDCGCSLKRGLSILSYKSPPPAAHLHNHCQPDCNALQRTSFIYKDWRGLGTLRALTSGRVFSGLFDFWLRAFSTLSVFFEREDRGRGMGFLAVGCFLHGAHSATLIQLWSRICWCHILYRYCLYY